MTTTTTTLHPACLRRGVAGAVVGEEAMPIPQTTTPTRITTMTTTVTTTTITVVVMTTLTTVTTTVMPCGPGEAAPAEVGRPLREPVGHHQPVAEVATRPEEHPWAPPEEAAGVEEGPSHPRGEAVALGAPVATVGAMLAASGRRTSSTSPTRSAARPPTSRTGGHSPSLSSPCSKGATTLVTMVTVMTTWSFPRILMGSSGSKTPLTWCFGQQQHHKTHTPLYTLSFTHKTKTRQHLTQPENWQQCLTFYLSSLPKYLKP